MLNKDNNLLAILGPTNTGKTYLAFERLITYKSGIFGFPLRLLARENYDKAVKKIGLDKVALITGEEKIVPKEARYFFCTVESMPINIDVECVAIDEIQLASDYERGHIFTDRILNLRGEFETIFLGSQIIENVLIKLFPKIKIEKRNRFSKLTYSPKKSLSKLNPRSVIIAFNINSVYEIAETLRAHKGGAAVVLGSLSPRTRNAQVEVYEDKKVDYLVATDAIGMGLNLNIDHVSFSSLQKFDGRYSRNLYASELGQIAGRAGRYKNDGTFGNLKNSGNFDAKTIQCIENSQFDSINKIFWRNSEFDFSSVEAVNSSFKQFPIKNFFIHKKNAEDEINFRTLSNDALISPYLNNKNSISLLWDVCRIPDFQKIFNDTYLDLLKNIFLILMKNDGIINEKWLQEKILRLENYSGGIEELSIKIANIRTWTYIANQSKWIKDYFFWQHKTSEIETNLSDYLHKSLVNRFVDFTASYFVNTKNKGEFSKIEVDYNNNIKLNGQSYGYINGFDLELKIPKSESLFSINHVKKSIRNMIEEKIKNFLKAPLDSLNLGKIEKLKINEDVKIFWGDEPIGKISKGKHIFSPIAETFNSEFLESDQKKEITQKLQKWLDNELLSKLSPINESIDDGISSEVRAIVYNVFNQLGTMPISENYKVIKNLKDQDKINISKIGLRVGAKFFFMPNLLKKSPMELKALLWKVFYNSNEDIFYPFPTDGRVSFISEHEMPESYWLAIGYKFLNKFLIRIDVFEKIFFLARQKSKYGPFFESSDLMNPVGCNSDQLDKVLKYCGFSSLILNDKRLYFHGLKKQESNKNINIKNKKTTNLRKKNIKKKLSGSTKVNNKRRKKEKSPDPNSPFAVLEKLL